MQALPINSLTLVSRQHQTGEIIRSPVPQPMAGYHWVARFSYQAREIIDRSHIVMQGTNDENLEFTAYVVEKSSYPSLVCNYSASSLNVLYLGTWILSKFPDIDQVILGLKGVCVWGDSTTLPLEFRVKDRSGDVLNIKFANGSLIHDVSYMS
jgi:penicillin V acylase-like amidase (Ntn superfamily)